MKQETKDDLKNKLARERQKLAGMGFMEKLDYLWTYYKIWLLVAAAIGCVFYLIGSILYNSTFDTVLGVAVINDYSYASDGMEPWIETLHEELELDKKELVSVEYNITVDPTGDSMDELSYASLAKVTALIASKAVDVMLTDEETITAYEENSAFRDLREVLPQTLYEQLMSEDRILFAEDEQGEQVACGLRLPEGRMNELCGSGLEPAYAAVLGNSEHEEMTLRFINYLLGE